MYGTEYYNVGGTLGSGLHYHDVPCAVCYVPSRGTEMMVPAQYTCPAGWTLEYYGYLMAEHYTHKHSSQFVCVDHKAEYRYGTHSRYSGAFMFPVEGRCGSLPCGPFVEGYELTCAVCTK
ncbi:predicted protein [Nematostella vectensis]|uniref:Short-chain collagen C4-like n=1 Tax=Nematostella vectensis TaxID=45351 RepID=A7RKH3_NEMVE|nr:predicted protein [Nematostella vectensis]|eukprot:XP_001639974.1 predicted protein [Nematostella vectensis]